MIKKFLSIYFLTFALVPVLAVEPIQTIENTKGFVGINYDRQDSGKTGTQKIINDHSFFNINIQIIKKGALFDGKKEIQQDEAKK